ncbi:TetR/AcrR family transcriptional regulator [Aestuariivirga sp.]|uniref:TetR/AcrR family transcriptional regulator n=1 Tax=Aestuariivirga sp. TaxID=2650926 RepID=UPI0039E3E64A
MDLILKAAENVFASMGYGDATMEEVARACGMAKKSVYRLFPDKSALFRALIQSYDSVEGWLEHADNTAGSHEKLRSLLFGLASFILSRRQVTLTRLVISEARKSPELADLFYRECIDRAQTLVAERLQSVDLFPLHAQEDARKLIVDIFLGATLGQLHLQALILDTDPETLMQQLRIRADAALAVLLSLRAAALQPAS